MIKCDRCKGSIPFVKKSSLLTVMNKDERKRENYILCNVCTRKFYRDFMDTSTYIIDPNYPPESMGY